MLYMDLYMDYMSMGRQDEAIKWQEKVIYTKYKISNLVE